MYNHKKAFERMERIALDENVMVLKSDRKYLEMNLFDHPEEFQALLNGKGNALIEFLGGVFEFTQIRPKGVFIQGYRNGICSALTFDEYNFLAPFNPECGTLCSLVSNEKSACYVQRHLLKKEKDLETNVSNLDFRYIRDLKQEMKKLSINIKNDEYNMLKFTGETGTIETTSGGLNCVFYKETGLKKSHGFAVKQSVSINKKIANGIKDREKAESIKKYTEINNAMCETEAMHHSLKESGTKISTYVGDADYLSRGGPREKDYQVVNITNVLVNLKGNNKSAVLKSPFLEGISLNFLCSGKLFLKRNVVEMEKINKYII